MKLLKTKQEILQIRPNMVNYIEEDERGLHFHYATNEPWALYLGSQVLYRKEAKMNVIEQAWERDFYSLLELRIQLDSYLASGSKNPLELNVKDAIVPLRHFEVLFLRQEIEGIVRFIKAENGKWEVRPVGQRVPTEHLYAVS